MGSCNFCSLSCINNQVKGDRWSEETNSVRLLTSRIITKTDNGTVTAQRYRKFPYQHIGITPLIKDKIYLDTYHIVTVNASIEPSLFI